MTINIQSLECPKCGAPIHLMDEKCEHCNSVLIITSINQLEEFNPSEVNKYLKNYKTLLKDDPNNPRYQFGMGVCYLELKLFDRALRFFEKALDEMPESAKIYYYYALALLNGKRPKVHTFSEIKKIEDYINSAIDLDDTKAEYHYLLALIKYDFYVTNGLRQQPPTYTELIALSREKEHNKKEIDKMITYSGIKDDHVINMLNEHL